MINQQYRLYCRPKIVRSPSPDTQINNTIKPTNIQSFIQKKPVIFSSKFELERKNELKYRNSRKEQQNVDMCVRYEMKKESEQKSNEILRMNGSRQNILSIELQKQIKLKQMSNKGLDSIVNIDSPIKMQEQSAQQQQNKMEINLEDQQKKSILANRQQQLVQLTQRSKNLELQLVNMSIDNGILKQLIQKYKTQSNHQITSLKKQNQKLQKQLQQFVKNPWSISIQIKNLSNDLTQSNSHQKYPLNTSHKSQTDLKKKQNHPENILLLTNQTAFQDIQQYNNPAQSKLFVQTLNKVLLCENCKRLLNGNEQVKQDQKQEDSLDVTRKEELQKYMIEIQQYKQRIEQLCRELNERNQNDEQMVNRLEQNEKQREWLIQQLGKSREYNKKLQKQIDCLNLKNEEYIKLRKNNQNYKQDKSKITAVIHHINTNSFKKQHKQCFQKISLLLNQLQIISIQSTTLKSQYNLLSSNHQTLKNQHQQMINKISLNQTTHISQKQKIAFLIQQINTKDQQISNIHQKYTQLQHKIYSNNNLNNKYQYHQQIINKITSKCQQYQKQLELLNIQNKQLKRLFMNSEVNQNGNEKKVKSDKKNMGNITNTVNNLGRQICQLKKKIMEVTQVNINLRYEYHLIRQKFKRFISEKKCLNEKVGQIYKFIQTNYSRNKQKQHNQNTVKSNLKDIEFSLQKMCNQVS